MTPLLLVMSCAQDNHLATRTDVQGPNDYPDIVVTPDVLDFGTLAYQATGTQTFVIGNNGTDHSVLTVDEVYLASGDAFTLLDAPTEPFELRFGEERSVTASFATDMPGGYVGQVIVHSDDEDEPATPVALDGDGTMPMLAVTPNTFDYGDVMVGCEKTAEFVLENIGSENLDVSSALQDGDGYAVAERAVLPTTLAPGDATTVTLGFSPFRDGASTGSLTVASNDPRGDQGSVLLGNGVFPGMQRVSYTVPTVNKLDLLVFVDQSASMDDDQAKLADNAATFAASLTAMAKDVQVMVVTRDDGCGSTIMKPDAPDFVAQFQSAVLDAPASTWTEAGLYVTLLAVRATDAFLCNDGFLRDDALLHVIMISDEPDQSPVGWYDVVSELRTKKGASHLVKMSAVAGPVPWGCYEANVNSATAGYGYYEATEATDGGFVDLCSDWAPQLNVIATYDITRATYALIGVPDVTTLTVMVDGVRRTTGWHYMSDSNTVVFDVDVPHSGQTVDLTFDVPLVCP